MRQIALFTTDWNYELVGETLRGIAQFLELHPDVCVRVFDCFGMDESAIADRQVYEIYRLVDWEHYDGAIVQTHQIVLREEADRIGQSLRSRGIPAVTLGIPLGGFPQVKSDDYKVFRHITNHLIQRHGVRKLWFLKGPEEFDKGEDSEARQRRYGFTDACRNAGIPEENLRYLPGNWQKDSGERAARIILESGERPEALVCANDDMALGAVSILQKSGVAVPGEIRVTGFDGIFSSSLCSPRLATVDRNFQGVGFKAMETLMSIIDGNPVPPVNYNDFREALTGTCGCRGNVDAEIIRIKDRFYWQTRFLREFYVTQDKIAGAFFSAESLEDVMSATEKYASIFGGSSVRIYLDAPYYRSLKGREEPGDEELMAAGHYSGSFVLVADSRRGIAREAEHLHVLSGDSQGRIQDSRSDQERLIQYYPIRYGRIMAGALVLEGLSVAAEMNLHESIVNELALSMETIRQHQHLLRLNEKLNILYAKDQLTDLYNRFGLDRFGGPLFERLKSEGKTVSFLFLDIDDMKGINDRHGHDAGDEALRAAAEALRRVCRPGDYMMRYGGDEFVAFGPERNEDPKAAVDQTLAKICEERKISFGLHLSVGLYQCPPDSAQDLKSCLKSADARMYDIKKNKKRC